MDKKLVVIIILLSFLFTMYINPGISENIFKNKEEDFIIYSNSNKLSIINENELLRKSEISSKVFCQNKGQLKNAMVQFYTLDGMVWFTDDGVFLEVRDESSMTIRQSTVDSHESRLVTDEWRPETREYRRVVLKQEFLGANKVLPIGRERLSWDSNFFYGNDSNNWCTDVPNYTEIWYENLYDGIDLRYYSTKNGLKYDLIVNPGADPEQIALKYNGANSIKIQNNNLLIYTDIKTLIDGDLYIYQKNNGISKQINGDFIKGFNNSELKFEISEDYDVHKKLIIDPHIKLEFSTFLGGSLDEPCQKVPDFYAWKNGIVVDSQGNTYITGYTYSSDFPTTPGANNTIFGGTTDGFIFKLNPNGTQLLFSTFIGGSDIDRIHSIAVDSQECSYIAGQTGSSDFPTTPGALNTTYNGASDCVALKLNRNGSKLIYSTFIGGYNADWGYSMVIDESGNSFISGFTYSTDFPTTPNAYDESNNGGYDCFVLKLNQNGSNLLFSTYIGGGGNDYVPEIDIDGAGNTIITALTESSDFPTTQGTFDSIKNGLKDCVVFKLNSNGTDLIYSTYLGGDGWEHVTDVIHDSYGNAIVLGQTNSSNFPIVTSSFDTIFSNYYDGFITKINSNGTKLIFSSFIGGQGGDCCFDIAIDNWNNIFITGFTGSSDFPITPDAIKSTLGYFYDGFLLELDANCSNLIYSTFIGGTFNDWIFGIDLDTSGNIYLTGGTDSPDLNTTSGAYDTTYNGYLDVFVQKYNISRYIKINSVSLLKNNIPTNLIYSRLGQYTFKINITDTFGFFDIKNVQLILNSSIYGIQLYWDNSKKLFTEHFDPNDYIRLETSSTFYNLTREECYFEFNVTVNWTFPDEQFQDARIIVNSYNLKPVWYNLTNFFRVENDLVFNGELSVTDESNRKISNHGLVHGSEQLTWTGLTPVYENTTDIYPPTDEFDISIWDEDGNYWLDSPESGQSMNITTITPYKTTNSFNYTINLTGIPSECDKTNHKFTIKIDADNVTFSNPWPGNDAWQKNPEIYTGITITDHGGGVVDNSSIMHSISEDNGATWSNWDWTEFAGESESITVHDFAAFSDGDDNFIKWRAKDSLGNGPAESEPYRILVDTQPVYFSNPVPLPTQVSSIGELEVGITIIDNTSGVNASTIKYSISTDAGNDWSSWKAVTGFQNGNNVDVKINLTFSNGMGNRIRWRAYDIAGNGPAYSNEYIINVNIPTPPVIIIPEIQLVSPTNNSKLATTMVKLTWEVINNYRPNIVFDIKLDTITPPQDIIEQNFTDSNIIINDLVHGQTYYWTVIPRLNNVNGTCLSGIWSFKIELPLPKVTLLTPANGSEITSTRPTLTWDLEYTGSNMVEYDIYFGTDMTPVIYQDNVTTKYFSIDYTLKDNTTYYWYIEPFAGGLRGYQSPVWSFTVKLKQDNKIPQFGTELDIDPNPLEIKSGEVKFVSVIVTNLGELKDNFTIIIGDINNSKLTAENYRQDTMEIEPGKNKEFLIMISVQEGTEPGYGNITITAKSKLAEKYNLDVMDSKELTVKIIEKDVQKHRDRPTSTFYFSLLLLIVILIIIFIIILILIRKKASKKEMNVQDSQEVITETSVEGITSPGPEPIAEPVPPVQVQQIEDIQTTQQDEQEE